MTMKRTILLTSVAFVFVLQCLAQPICDIKEYTIKDGLAQSILSGLLQDKKGFMWFGTWDGLNKFDGYTFRKYKSVQGDGSSMTNNRLRKITESQYGDIWCQTYLEKAYLFDSATETFIDVLGALEAEREQTFVVRRIVSLPKGIAWVTCDQGYNFRIDEKGIKENNGTTMFSTFSNTVKGEVVYEIYQDADGDEWILTNKGITIVGRKEINSDFPFQFFVELNNEIWLSRSNGKLAKYDKKTSAPLFIEIAPEIEHIHAIESIDNHTLAIGSEKGLILFNTQNRTSRLIDIRVPTQQNSDVTTIFKDKTGELWLLTQGKGITRVNIHTNEVQHLFTPDAEVVHYERSNTPRIFEDAVGCLWVLPRDGNLSYYDRKNKRLESYLINPEDPKSAFHPYMRDLCIDKQGNVWFTSIRGVQKISFSERNYEYTLLDYGMEVRALLRDHRNYFWVASKSGKIRVFDAQENFKGFLSNTGGLTQGANSFVHSAYCFMEDENENIWIGSRHDGIFLLQKEKGTSFGYRITNYTHHPEDPYSLSNNSVYSIYQDNQKRIWIGSYQGGINLIGKNEKNELIFIHNGNRLNNHPSTLLQRVRHITQIGDSVMMAGTTDGLLTFSSNFNQPEEIKFYHNYRKPQISTSLNGNDVMQVFTDSRKNTYIVTFSGGINKIVSSNLLSDTIAFKAYTERSGLSSDLTLSMAEDQSGHLWIVSENALTRFDPLTEQFENYNQQFLPNNVYFSEAIPCETASGSIVFGSDHGIVGILPKDIRKSNYIPPIVFTDVKIQNSDLYTDIDGLKKLTLSPKQRNITLQFAALDYKNSQNISYAYRLKGLEDKWNYSDKNRSASYLNIPKGKYNFEIKSTNSDGVWVDNLRTLTIEVQPTFQETVWAWILYLLFFIILTGTIVYVLFYIYRLRHRVDMEQQLSNIKLRFFTDISHELRTPLTLISTPVTEVLEHEPLTPTAKEHLTLVQKNTNRMLELINQILDFRKIQNKKMKILVEEVEVIALLSKIADCFRLVADEKRITFSLNKEINTALLWVDKDKFEKIFNNLISNAFKYTPSGKHITIAVASEAKNMVISIIDEGIGIHPQKLNSLFQRFETLDNRNTLHASSGIGLSLVKELVELHHGSIEVISEPGGGCEFKVKFPTGNEHFKEDKQAELIFSDTSTFPADVSPGEPNEITAGQDDEMVNAPQEKLSILVVEDNEELRGFLNTILSRRYLVLQASNGQEGLDMTIQYVPDLIISDVMMPVMDGLEMANHIKENINVCHIPIVLLSAKSALDDHVKGLESGIDDYITKPFSATYLKTRINTLLKQRKLLQERYITMFIDKRQLTVDIHPSEPQITSFDKVFLEQAVRFVEDNIDNVEMTIEEFASALKMSRTVFYRKLKTIVGLTPVDFVREIRIKRAAQLIDSNEYTFSQIAYMSGFNDPKYFTKCFKKHFGVTPSEYKDNRILRN